MQFGGLGALLIEIVLFVVVAARCGWELLSTSPQCIPLLRWLGHSQDRLRELVPTEGESGSGVGARRSIQGMLAVACVARAGLIAFVLLQGAWVPYLSVPDLAYLTTYGLLVVFLAQMQQMTVGSRYLWVKLAASFGLLSVLVVSLIVCTVRWGTNPLSRRSLLLRKFLYYELGVTYLLLFLAFVYFGARICVAARRNKSLFYRILLLTTVCGLALSTKGAFFVAAAANAWRTDELFPRTTGRYRFEALMALEELLPSLAIMFLTARGKSRHYTSASPTEVTGIWRYSNSHGSGAAGSSPGPPSSASYSYGSALNSA